MVRQKCCQQLLPQQEQQLLPLRPPCQMQLWGRHLVADRLLLLLLLLARQTGLSPER
jgi:hypothetical protein